MTDIFQIHLVLPPLGELKTIVSRLSHSADDMTISASHVRPGITDSPTDLPGRQAGAEHQVEQGADDNNVGWHQHPDLYMYVNKY